MDEMKRILIVLPLLFFSLAIIAGQEETGRFFMNSDTNRVMIDSIRGYDSNTWIEHDNALSSTTLTITKAAKADTIWVLTDFSAGGTQNGYLVVKVNGVEKWRLYFPANGSVGQRVSIVSGKNESISITVTLSTSGDITANMRGTSYTP